MHLRRCLTSSSTLAFFRIVRLRPPTLPRGLHIYKVAASGRQAILSPGREPLSTVKDSAHFVHLAARGEATAKDAVEYLEASRARLLCLPLS